MAIEIGVAAIKIAMGVFNAYQDKKKELASFESDFDKLHLRVLALQGIIDVVEGNLDPKLNWFIYPAKRQLDEASEYTKSLLEFCQSHKNQAPKFREICSILLSSAAEVTLPDGIMKDTAMALLKACGHKGVPEKAYASFAEDISWLIMTIGSMSSASSLNRREVTGQKMDRQIKSIPYSASAGVLPSIPNLEAEQQEVQKEFKANPDFLKINPQKMTNLMEESITYDTAQTRFIFLDSFEGASGTQHHLLAVWIEKVPFLMRIIQASSLCPSSFWMCVCPSTEFLCKLVTELNDSSNNETKQLKLESTIKSLPELVHKAASQRRAQFKGIPTEPVIQYEPYNMAICIGTCCIGWVLFKCSQGMCPETCGSRVLEFKLPLRGKVYYFQVGHLDESLQVKDNMLTLRLDGNRVPEFNINLENTF